MKSFNLRVCKDFFQISRDDQFGHLYTNCILCVHCALYGGLKFLINKLIFERFT
jgi:hypothetical protein